MSERVAYHSGPRRVVGLVIVLLVSGCDGDAIESLVKLISARFVPETVALGAGGTTRVELEVTCSNEGLSSPFGRLGIEVKLDPEALLPAGVTATVFADSSESVVAGDGYTRFRCGAPFSDPGLSVARAPVDISVAPAVTAGPLTLTALVRIEPLNADAISKDTTLAELGISVLEAASGGNLVANASFESAVVNGGLPTGVGYWRGDLSASVSAENDITPHDGAYMLKFQATGLVGSTNTLASQQWQVVDLRPLGVAAVGAGTASAVASAWFNRVTGDSSTDQRFDIRLLAFDGEPTELPTRFASGTWIATSTTTIITTGNAWQQAQVSLALPSATSYVLVELYAFEDVVNDADGVELAGHYADEVSLVLVSP